MLITLPIGLLVGAFVCDVVFWIRPGDFWATAAFWALVGGIATALLAAVVGLIDFTGDARIRALRDAWEHMVGNLIAVGLAAASVYMRYRFGTTAGVLPWGIALSGATVLLLAYTGWKGGEMTFRHHVGVIDGPADR